MRTNKLMNNLRPIHNRSGKANVLMTVALIAIIAIAALVAYNTFGKKEQTAIGPGTNVPTTASGEVICKDTKPDNLAHTLTLNMQNSLNRTGVETYDTTSYFFDKADGSLQTAPTDTTSGSVTLTWGKQYLVKTLSTSGAAGDGSWLKSGSSDAWKGDNNGNLIYSACGTAKTETILSYQHGLRETRVFDVINNNYLINNGTTAATSWITGTPLNFSSTTSNSTATAVGAGGEVHVIQYLRATVDDQNVNDRGIYVLIDADTSDWNTPTVKIDGAVAKDVKGELSSDAKAAYSAYEYVYLISADRVISQQKDIQIDLDMFALSGYNPTGADSPIIALAPIGQYASTYQNNVLKVDSVQDDSARTVVHTLETTTLSIT